MVTHFPSPATVCAVANEHCHAGIWASSAESVAVSSSKLVVGCAPGTNNSTCKLKVRPDARPATKTCLCLSSLRRRVTFGGGGKRIFSEVTSKADMRRTCSVSCFPEFRCVASLQ